MNKYLRQVIEFMLTFKQPVIDYPLIPKEDRSSLRVNLIEEELKELKEAIAKGDKVAVMDAFCDLQYVLSGAIVEFGMQQTAN